MPFDSDVALLGTGVAPLVAASNLVAQGKSVLILNPDLDFFLEDSELPLDPLLPQSTTTLDPARLAASSVKEVMNELGPAFPGAVEVWGGNAAPSEGYHDPGAPHVRQRSRLWISPGGGDRNSARQLLEDAYVRVSDADLKPQLLEGLQAIKRFPGGAVDRTPLFPIDPFSGLVVPNLCDVDVSRYRNGILEFVRERVSDDRVVCSAAQIEPSPEGVRFHANGSAHTARLRDGMLVFWTPRLTPWVLLQARKFEVQPRWPLGMRLWEEWSLVSRYAVDPSVVGIYGNLAAWAEVEGTPGAEGVHRLAVLMAGALLDMRESPVYSRLNWASQESFAALSNLCTGFLGWNRITMRGLRVRSVLEWQDARPWRMGRSGVSVVPAADGPLSQVVRQARLACERFGGAA